MTMVTRIAIFLGRIQDARWCVEDSLAPLHRAWRQRYAQAVETCIDVDCLLYSIR